MNDTTQWAKLTSRLGNPARPAIGKPLADFFEVAHKVIQNVDQDQTNDNKLLSEAGAIYDLHPERLVDAANISPIERQLLYADMDLIMGPNPSVRNLESISRKLSSLFPSEKTEESILSKKEKTTSRRTGPPLS